ncbi:hypothetical protein CIW54_23305 [Paraburkholderia sp. T12-10]|nr:hypothetical protein CIW54_23305 [Paraburkholderia sp. T12-10]
MLVPHNFIVYPMLTGMAFIAGTADAIAGGGGLITVPALLLAGSPPVQALGTDKLQSAIGELSATWHFLRRGGLSLKPLLSPLLFTCAGALIGVLVLKSFPLHALEKFMPWLLLSVLLYYIIGMRPDSNQVGTHSGSPPQGLLPGLGAGIGFYNGFFGPGTGTLWSVALMKWMKFGIHQATMWTKPLNLAANCAALGLFVAIGNINYPQAIIMGVGSFAGGKFGATLVLKVSAQRLRMVFISLMGLSTAALFIKYYV